MSKQTLVGIILVILGYLLFAQSNLLFKYLPLNYVPALYLVGMFLLIIGSFILVIRLFKWAMQ